MAKFGMKTERDKLKLSTMSAAIHGATIGRIPTVDHLRDIFHNNIPWMKIILNYFIIVFKNLL